MTGEDVNTFPRQPKAKTRNAERFFLVGDCVYPLGVGVNTFADQHPHRSPQDFNYEILPEMKTKKNVQTEINEIIETLTTQQLSPSVAGKLKNRIPVLKECLMYLETNPTDEFVASELERLDYLINKCMSRFVIPEGKIPKKEWAELRKEHENQYGIPTMRKQARILRYLLNSD